MFELLQISIEQKGINFDKKINHLPWTQFMGLAQVARIQYSSRKTYSTLLHDTFGT
jgi:hypothetical protein